MTSRPNSQATGGGERHILGLVSSAYCKPLVTALFSYRRCIRQARMCTFFGRTHFRSRLELNSLAKRSKQNIPKS